MSQWARQYLGKPFKSFGRGPNEFDCWGLVHAIYRNELGVSLPHYSISPACTGLISDTMDKDLNSHDWEETKEPSEFDIVIMALNWDKPNLSNHIGIYLGSGACIHSIEETGVVIINLSHPLWRNRVRGYYKWQSN